MTHTRRLIKRITSLGAERGAIVVVAAIGLTMAIALLGLVVDGGVVRQERRRLQNAADAAALAGVQRLPANPSAAVSDAVAWAAKNGAGSASAVVSTTNAANDTITVTITNNRALSISSFFGKGSASVTKTRLVGHRSCVTTGEAFTIGFTVAKSQSSTPEGRSNARTLEPVATTTLRPRSSIAGEA